MSEKDITQFFTDETLSKPINLQPIMGGDLIYDHRLDVGTFTGKICGVGMLLQDNIRDVLYVVSSDARNHDSLFWLYANNRHDYQDENPGLNPPPALDLYTAYGYITDNGYFLTRAQACEVGMLNGQVSSTNVVSIKSYEIKNWVKVAQRDAHYYDLKI